MKNSLLIIFFGMMFILPACEHRAVDPRILSRPTIPDANGINRADTIPIYDNKRQNENK